MNTNYDDIINLPAWQPQSHPRMSMEARAAQFAPFAALSGYDDAIDAASSAGAEDSAEEQNID